MKIKLLGLNLTPGKGISLADFFSHIAGQNGAPIEVGGYGRFVYIDEIDGYHVGLVITTKDHNKFLQFKRDQKSVKLEARDISDGSKLADFNFFAVSKKTGRGIYQYYHQSCALSTFGNLCRAYYEVLKKEKIDAALRLDAISAAKEKKIRSQLAGTLKLDIVVRGEKFDTLVSELQSVQAITLSVSTMAYQETAFSPLALSAKNTRQRFTFQKDTPTSQIARGLKNVLKATAIDGVKVEGTDSQGLEQIIKLVNTPDQFGEYDFDEVAETMTIVPSEFAKSDFLKEMIGIAKSAIALRE